MKQKTPITAAVQGIRSFRRNLDRIIIQEAAKDIHWIEELNREALLEGKNTKGNNLTPSYLSDPYFKSRKAAKAYSDWKDKITPNPQRASGTPNLFIDGTFHSTILYKKSSQGIFGSSNSEIANEIESKYHGTVIGLNPEKKGLFIHTRLKPRVQKRLRQAIGIN